MTYQNSDDTKQEDAIFSTLLGWLAAAATIIASVASVTTFASV
jgi:hypothetical protein